MSALTMDAVTQNKPLQDIIAISQAEKESPSELCSLLYCLEQWDLLVELKSHPIYGEEAQRELETHEWMEKSRKAFEEHCSKYPDIFKRWREVLKSSPQLGIFDVSYPGMNAIREGMGQNFVAISGDGLFLFQFEVLSLEGEGSFRFTDLPSRSQRGQDATKFVMTCEHTGIDITGTLTGTQIADLLAIVFGEM